MTSRSYPQVRSSARMTPKRTEPGSDSALATVAGGMPDHRHTPRRLKSASRRA